jgi:hypothetical protein
MKSCSSGDGYDYRSTELHGITFQNNFMFLYMVATASNLGTSSSCNTEVDTHDHITNRNSVAVVREQTIPTERPPLVGKVMPTFSDRGV